MADFCPVCRDIAAFKVIRVGDASHLAFVSLGNGRFAGRMIRCSRCDTGRAFDDKSYRGIVSENLDTAALIASTHPNVRAKFAERLELEARLRTDLSVLSGTQREELLLEPFQELDPEIEQLDKGTLHQKKASMWGLLAMCAAIGGGGAIIRFDEAKVGWVIGGGMVAFVAVWVGILIVLEGRGMKRRIMPCLAGALRPLRPTKEELQKILARCRNAGLCSGKKVKLDPLWKALQATPT